MGKRSPILGYNHNVRYRGLVFHVQTEDSGVATPHLFTHLFHNGVIVSTRKLDYDAGSAEESIKALMQAQHKAVLKDLRRGHFDDKIDSYLGGTPGLLPRGAEEPPERTSEAELVPPPGTVEEVAAAAPTERMPDGPSAPVVAAEKPPARATVLTPPSSPSPARSAGHASSAGGPGGVPVASAAPAARGTAAVDVTLRTAAPAFDAAGDFGLSVELELDDDDPVAAAASRRLRDTEAQVPITAPARPQSSVERGGQTRPTLDLDDHTRPTPGTGPEEGRRVAATSDKVPGAIRPPGHATPPPLPSDSRRFGDRPSPINAAALPPARPISRPPARPMLSSPQAASRPAAPEDRRRDPEGAEMQSPAPSQTAELLAGERPGQYAQLKKAGPRSPAEGPRSERSASVPVPAGLGRPQRVASAPNAKQATAAPSSGSAPAPRESPRSHAHTEPLRGRVPTPSRFPVPSRPAPTAGGGVVMTRPALIVGAPAKTAATVPRIRKAREDEGRGFGQGLISEKSLDEVILAYLSEDADDK